MRTPTQVRFAVALLGLATAIIFSACGPRPPKAPPAATKFLPSGSHGWTEVLINPTDTPRFLGFRARYVLTENEYETVPKAQVWKQLDVRSLMSLNFFLQIDATYVRKVRAKGTGGWCTGYFAKDYYSRTKPESLFANLNGVVYRAPDSPPGEPSGMIVRDYPDGQAALGQRIAEIWNRRPNVVDITDPNFKTQMQALTKPILQDIADSMLPWPVARLPIDKRATALATLDTFLPKVRNTMKGKHEWMGTLVFPNHRIPVLLISDCLIVNETNLDIRLDCTLYKLAPNTDPISVNGALTTDTTSTLALESFRMNSANMSGESLDTTRQRMSTAPMSHFWDTQNFYVRILNSRQIEIRADGIPVSVLALQK
jgi:hypothetical protein